jgi:hypothetical protein
MVEDREVQSQAQASGMQGIKHGLCVFVCDFVGIEGLVPVAFTILLTRKFSKVAKVVTLPAFSPFEF